ncbi:MAG: metalloregulator ArsR/SmtB family transcription factor [Methanoregula sp.]|jgi:ArsR family transcriptional regulator
MPRTRKSCCVQEGTGPLKTIPTIPPSVQEELDRIGGFDALGESIPSAKEIDTMSRRYHALSDPHRLKILYLLRDQPLCVCVIKRFMRIADSKLSYHLTILKEGGLIEGEYHGNWNIYSLTDLGKQYVVDHP